MEGVVSHAVTAGRAAAMGKEVAAKTAELKKTFEEGVTASRAGNHDEAIAAFTKAAELNQNCYDCYYNIAFSQSQKKDYDKAEDAYKKAIGQPMLSRKTNAMNVSLRIGFYRVRIE